MKLKMDIPTTLDDITLRQYKEFFKFQEENTNLKVLHAQMISVFCNVPLEEVLRMRYKDTQEVIKILDELFIEKPKLVRKFQLNKVEYGFHPSLDDLTLGEYVDLDSFIGDWHNIEKAMNVLYRPIEARFAEKYSIQKYKVENAEYILDMPMSAVTSSLFFFVDFRDRLVQDYDGLFGQGSKGGLDRVSQFGAKWGWYQSIYELAQGDVTRVEHITELNIHQCFMMLSYLKDKNDLENKQIKSSFK